MALPPLLVLTDGTLTRGGRCSTSLLWPSPAARGPFWSARSISIRRRATLAARVRALLDPHGGLLLVASDHHIDADGVHLAARDPFPAIAAGIVGRSCHNAGEVARAAGEGCDYVTLSPIFPSPSKPGYGPALGVAALADLPLPVWALGGVTHVNAQACVDAGAAGVAVMGAIMGADDPAAATRRLADVVGAGRP